MTQYDDIAEQYDRANNERPDRARIFLPSAKRYLGGIAGLDILDLACGSGFFSRFMRMWGARIVMGVDVSEKMIQRARAREKERPLGIDYRVADVSKLDKLERLGEFDVAFGGFLLHYAPTDHALWQMCQGVARNLKKGGRFVAFNENPSHPLHNGRKYDVETRAIGPLRDGVEIRRTHYRDGAEAFVLSHFHFQPSTYETALTAAGFTEIEWKPFIKGVGADEGLPEGYWDDFTSENFSVAVLVCEKL